MTTNADTYGYVLIHWTNASRDSGWVAWRVYRRQVGGAWELLDHITNDVSSYDYHDWIFASGASYEYAVVQLANRFGTLIESAYNPTVVTPVSTDYWLISKDGIETDNVRLSHVKAETFEDEHEQETINLIGAGRHVDYGERWGYKGSLTADLRDEAGGLTARAQRLAIEAVRDNQSWVWFRNPFGDLFPASIDAGASFTRTPGIGQREFGSFTIPYEEVGELAARASDVTTVSVDGGSP